MSHLSISLCVCGIGSLRCTLKACSSVETGCTHYSPYPINQFPRKKIMQKIELLTIFLAMAVTAKLISLAYENSIYYKYNANNKTYQKAWNFRWFAVRLISIYEVLK